jgi:hypothetical protein
MRRSSYNGESENPNFRGSNRVIDSGSNIAADLWTHCTTFTRRATRNRTAPFQK